MVTFIEVMDGPQRGNQYKVQSDVTLGRTLADILIEDPKVSSTHAKFVINEKGNYSLVDLESSNGLKINGRRVKKISLLPGVTFEIGSTQFRVLLLEDESAPIFDKILTWRDRVRHKLGELITDYPIRSKNIFYTEQILQLEFIQGIQASEEVYVTYLPRRAGFGNLDINLKDTEVPKDAFELIRDNNHIRIRIFSPGLIKLNDKAVSAATLESEDIISFGSTRIKVNFLEG